VLKSIKELGCIIYRYFSRSLSHLKILPTALHENIGKINVTQHHFVHLYQVRMFSICLLPNWWTRMFWRRMNQFWCQLAQLVHGAWNDDIGQNVKVTRRRR